MIASTSDMGTKWRVQNKKLFFTYKYHITKDKIVEFMENVTGKKVVLVVAGHENGDSEVPYQHTHIVVEWDEMVQSTNARLFDLQNGEETVHPHIKKVRNGRANLDRVCAYCCKEDKEPLIIGWEKFEPKVNVMGILECEDTMEALQKYGRTVNDIIGIERLRELKETDDDVRHKKEHEWLRNIELNKHQKMWLENMEKQGRRIITWIVDPDGHRGKSTLGLWLQVTKGAFVPPSNTKDIMYMYEGEEYVVIDYERSNENYTVNYSAMERLKNGQIVSGKYKGKSKVYAPPKMIVFSNFEPEVWRMTWDRWDIIQYKPSGIHREPKRTIIEDE